MNNETDDLAIKYDRNDPDDWYKLKQLALYGYGPLDVVVHEGEDGYIEQIGED